MARGRPVPSRGLALAVLCLSLLIVTLDNTVLNVVLPVLVRDLAATTTQLQWIVDAYVLVFAGLLLVCGSAADRVGRKWTYLAGLAVFAAGSAAAAFSGHTAALIAARAGMGIGGALIMPSTLSIITAMYPDGAARHRAIGIWAGTSGAGVALGPIIGGLLLARFWWGSVFLINLPIAAIALALAVPLVPNSRRADAKRPDIAGAALSVAGLGLLLWAIIEAPVRHWTSPLVIAAGTAGLAVLALFALAERRGSHPLLDLRMLRARSVWAAASAVALVTFGLFGALFVLTQYLQFSLGFTPLQTGVRVLPAAAAVAAFAPLSALAVRAAGARLTITAGLALIAAGLWQVSSATAATTYLGVLPGMILLGVGAGLAIPSATNSVMGSVPGGDTGVAAATNGSFMQLGGALGVAVIGSLLTTRYQGEITAALAPYHVPHVAMSVILGSLGGALEVAARAGGVAGALLAQAARAAFVSGMDLGLRVGAAVALAGAVIALATLPGRPRGRRPRAARGRVSR